MPVKITLLTSYLDSLAAYKARRLFQSVNLDLMCDVFAEKRESKDTQSFLVVWISDLTFVLLLMLTTQIISGLSISKAY